MTNNGSKLRQNLLGSIFVVESGLRKTAAELTSFTASLLGLPVCRCIAYLFVRLSVVLKHLLEWVCSAHQLEIVEGNLARYALSLGDTCPHSSCLLRGGYDDLSVLLGGSRVLFDCFVYAISSFC